jgi:hypothetical protein
MLLDRVCLRGVSGILLSWNGWAVPPPVYTLLVVPKAQGWMEGGDDVVEKSSGDDITEQQGEVARANMVGANVGVVVPPSVG